MLQCDKESIDRRRTCYSPRYEAEAIAAVPIQLVIKDNAKAAHHRDEAPEKYDLHRWDMTYLLDANIHQCKEEGRCQHVEDAPVDFHFRRK
jgi:hypothetical protein